MARPSWQICAIWVKETLPPTRWVSLREHTFATLSQKWSGRSESEIWDLVDEGLQPIAEELRNEIATCVLDGACAQFEIDDEESPYLRSTDHTVPELLQKLRRICPFAFEDLCAKILNRLGANSYVTARSCDGGVDFIGKAMNIVPTALSVPAACKATVIGQAKRYQKGNVISEKALREFVGAIVLRIHSLKQDQQNGIGALSPVIGAFWTTSSFEPNARIYARAAGLWYMDGHTLASYVESLGLRNFVRELPDLMSAELNTELT